MVRHAYAALPAGTLAATRCVDEEAHVGGCLDTGDTVSSETRSFFESSCSLYLAKPFKIEEVKEVIQQTLEGGA